MEGVAEKTMFYRLTDENESGLFVLFFSVKFDFIFGLGYILVILVCVMSSSVTLDGAQKPR